MIIDQHRAHVRILFDRYITQITNRQGEGQRVLFPEIIQLPASEVVFGRHHGRFVGCRFRTDQSGGGSFAVNSIPSGVEGLDPVQLVRNMVHTAIEKGNDVKEEIQNVLALTLSKAAAIVYGQVLTPMRLPVWWIICLRAKPLIIRRMAAWLFQPLKTMI
jgi:DNA mismatch repair protein MutL